MSQVTQIITINMSGRDCRVSSIYFSFLVFGLQMFDDLCFSFKMDCEKQNNKSKSTVVMLRIAMQGCEKVKKHIQTLYNQFHNSF